MRKIESLMVKAVKAHKNWNQRNTKVSLNEEFYNPLMEVRLHNKLIFVSNVNVKRDVFLLHGYNTRTTRSRINVLLNELGYKFRLGTIKYELHAFGFGQTLAIDAYDSHVANEVENKLKQLSEDAKKQRNK